MANKIQIDLDRVEELALQGLTQVQISGALGKVIELYAEESKIWQDCRTP